MEKVPQVTSLPDGLYYGTWGGYVIEITSKGKQYELATEEGVRGIGIKVVVEIKDGVATFDTVQSCFSAGENSTEQLLQDKIMNTNNTVHEAQEPAFNKGGVMGSFSPVADSKATEALQFYEDCADNLPYYQTSEKDNGFDWDRCRAYCSVGKSYSRQRFMIYVAEWFGTTVKEMKLQWRNVK